MDSSTLQKMVLFTLAVISELRDTSKSFGIHCKYAKRDGVNLMSVFHAQFGVPLYTVQRDSAGKFVAVTGPLADMASTGAIAYRAVSGGYMVYDGKERSAALELKARERVAAEASAASSFAASIAAKIGGKR